MTKSSPCATTHRCTHCPGKTLFLKFMLARLISAKQVVLLSTGSRVYLFYRGKVYTRGSVDFSYLPRRQQPQLTLQFPVWALINSDGPSQPPIIDSDDNIWPIQASSPQPIRWKAWAKQRKATIVGMPLWSTDELMKGYVSTVFCHLSQLCCSVQAPR